MNKKLELAASKVCNNISAGEKEEFGSIITVIMVIGILLNLVRIIQECNKSSGDVNELAGNLTIMDKYRLNKAVKKGLKAEGLKFDKSLAQAFVEYGKVATVEELEEIFAQTPIDN